MTTHEVYEIEIRGDGVVVYRGAAVHDEDWTCVTEHPSLRAACEAHGIDYERELAQRDAVDASMRAWLGEMKRRRGGER